ncbi:hypothetical protein SLS62_010815 [Diatrype stigma]|uniref:Uncharacterized protein n=1 Tax=Diatrype stigma TaxID=117547 RepID=A0AAN9YH37_9PEZI
MYQIKNLIVLLASTSLLAPTKAAKCVGNTYDLFLPAVADQPLQCSGQLLGWGVEDGPGISPCLAPVNATCALVADQVDGANCTINLYNGSGTCDKAFLVGLINCAAPGAAYGAVFDRFDIECI